MPRSARIDIPGLLQHVIARGIERGKIFLDDHDKSVFLNRFAKLLRETDTDCYAWALLDNHFHLLLRPKTIKLADFMRRLLTGYAVEFNLRHRRAGHLFQNRFKSIVCDQNAYLLQLIRYIHLNPLRAGLVNSLEELDDYPWCGHSVLLNRSTFGPQIIEEVLALYSSSPETACKRYRQFMADGLPGLHQANLSGGGKRRSCELNPALGDDDSFDDRVLGGGDFVLEVLGEAGIDEPQGRRLSLTELLQQIASFYGVEPQAVIRPNKDRQLSKARGVFCHLALRQLGYRGADLTSFLGISPSGVCVAAKRGARILEDIIDLKEMMQRDN